MSVLADMSKFCFKERLFREKNSPCSFVVMGGPQRNIPLFFRRGRGKKGSQFFGLRALTGCTFHIGRWPTLELTMD